MSFLFKDLLSFEEVAEYLESHGYYYNINNEHDYNRLRNFIVDLYHERKLMPFFFYSGWGVVTVVKKKGSEVIDSREAYLKGYFGVVEIGEILRKILKEGKAVNIKDYECYHYSPDDIARLPIHGDDVYSPADSTSLTTVEFEVGKPSFFITFDDLRYSKNVLDRLLKAEKTDEESQQLIEAQGKITDLENQLAQAKAELADKPADDSTEQDHLYNWQAMDKNQYPPELHLAIEIWKEYYQVDAIKHISQFDAGRFNRIANDFNLSQGNLKSRIRSLLTPLNSKTKSPELLSSLEVINIIHNDKLEQD